MRYNFFKDIPQGFEIIAKTKRKKVTVRKKKKHNKNKIRKK
jgi:hypothetical protein